MHGKKLKGEFALVRTKQSENSWLLIKHKDKYATDGDITEKAKSVVSGKTLEQIEKAMASKNGTKSSTAKTTRSTSAKKSGAKKSAAKSSATKTSSKKTAVKKSTSKAVKALASKKTAGKNTVSKNGKKKVRR